MRRFLDDRTCPADLIAEQYDEERTAKACGGCGTCRAEPQRRRCADRRIVSAFPWSRVGGILRERLCNLLGATRVLVTSWPTEARDRARARRLRDLLNALVDDGIVSLELRGDIPSWVEDSVNGLERVVFVGRTSRAGERVLPTGPRIVLMGEGCCPTSNELASRAEGQEKVILSGSVPDDWHGRTILFEDLQARYRG